MRSFPLATSFSSLCAYSSVLLCTLSPSAGFADIDWAQPPLGCVEEVIAQTPKIKCLDLSSVPNPAADYPPGFGPTEKEYWSKWHRRELSICRSKEIMRRERANPGSMSPAAVEISWMRELSVEYTRGKIDAIYRAAETYGMPPQILLGALTQESLMAGLGIADDGGNFSCGVGQLNVIEYCRWAQSESVAVQDRIGWPRQAIAAYQSAHPKESVCEAPLLSTGLVRPIYQYGLKNLGGLPTYRLRTEHVRGVKASDAVPSYPAAPAAVQDLRFAMTRSFALSCPDYRNGIPAKARELARLYTTYVPAALRKAELYPAGKKFARRCERPYVAATYPAQTAWLAAVGIYNAGARVVQNAAYYLDLNSAEYEDPSTWRDFTPTDLIAALYWGGKYSSVTDQIHFTTPGGTAYRMPWFKVCVVQRHIARVVQHATLSGYEIAQTLEGSFGCQKSVFDENGQLIKSGVPPMRQISSGKMTAANEYPLSP